MGRRPEDFVVADRVTGLVGGQRTDLQRALAGAGRVIPFGAGDPDLPTPRYILDAFRGSLDQGLTHYTPVRGLASLRNAIALNEELTNHVSYDPDAEIIVTSGAQESVFLAMQALLNPGDEVLIADPYYPSYAQSISLAGGVLVPVPSYEHEDFVLKPAALRECVGPHVRLLVVISPGMPCSSVIPRHTLEEIAEVAAEHDLLVIHDELYHKIVFSGHEHVSLASLPGMRERTLVINGVSKTYCMTGWRVGWSMGPASIVQAMETLKSTVSICASAVAQRASEVALSGPQDDVAECMRTYESRRALLVEGLDAIGVPHGAWMGGFSTLINIKQTGMTSQEFALRFLTEKGVLVGPGDVFGRMGAGYVRVSLLQPLETLNQALTALAEVWPRYVGR